LKLNGTHQLLFYADNVNILGGSVHNIKKNADAFVFVIKENGIEVKTKYIILSRDENEGRNHSTKIDTFSFEREKNFKYLKKSLKNIKVLLRKKLRAD
jgi:hypothetical protein